MPVSEASVGYISKLYTKHLYIPVCILYRVVDGIMGGSNLSRRETA
jgi:hypothetical protein